MWPFTGKRIFGSRWWALGFVVFVCWQAVEFVSPETDEAAPINAQDAQKLTDALNAQ